MLESIQRYQIVDHAVLVTRTPGHPTSEQTHVVFPHLLPPAPLYVEVYQKLHGSLLRHATAPCVARVDRTKICISGRSSGGLTVLGALCAYPDVFRAGYAAYGVCDVAHLEQISHKFEACYTSQLMGGRFNEIPEVYMTRNPLHSAHRITAPVLLCQGDADKVVPPEQSRSMVDAIKNHGGSVRYIEFPGEGHSFRKPDNQATALRAEAAHLAGAVGLQGANTY